MKSYKENPFAQPQDLHCAEYRLAGEAMSLLPVALEDVIVASRSDDTHTSLHIYYDASEASEISERVSRLQKAGYEIALVESGEVPNHDWVAQSQASFTPIRAGEFFVHCDSYEGAAPAGLQVVQMNAGAAFGTGEHATTSGCLAHISALYRDGCEPSAVLDMGCGTAILAIAAKKLWPNALAVAVDVDPPAVDVSEHNCKLNDVQAQIAQSDGYANEIIAKHAPYGLILANILAKPLIGMAQQCVASLSKHGYAVLSGYTETQVEEVIQAHEATGLAHVKTDVTDGWASSLLQKRN